MKCLDENVISINKKNYFFEFLRFFMFRSTLMAFILVSFSLYADSWRTCQPNRVFIAPEYQNYHWSDHDSAVTTSQPRWGGVIGYEHLAPKKIYFRGWGRLGSGKSNDQIFYSHGSRVELDVGYTWSFRRCSDWLITPYTGLGYYRETHHHYIPGGGYEYEGYVPVGLLIGWDINYSFTIALRAQANIQIHRTLFWVGQGYSQSKRTDWVLELPFTYRFCQYPLDLSLVPEFAWNPNTRDSSGMYWGQQNIWGIRLELGVRF
jgi:hypothetical protein